jgi:hypothetical protein
MTWEGALSGLSSNIQQPHLCTESDDPSAFYLVALDGASRGRIYHTSNAGLTWVSTDWSGGVTKGIACDPVDPNVLYVAQFAPPRVVRSYDRGNTFEPFDNGLGFAGSPTTIVAARSGSTSQLLLSTNRGSYSIVLDPGGSHI